MRKGSKVQKEHFNYFMDVMQQVQWDIHETMLQEGEVPALWHEIARRRGPRAKTRLTLRVEEDVVKFFRGMGKGYQERMNDVLRAWMHGRIAGVIDGPDAQDAGVNLLRYVGRPRLGDTELQDCRITRRRDGTLWHLEQERVVEEAELGGMFRTVRGADDAKPAAREEDKPRPASRIMVPWDSRSEPEG